MPIGYAQVSTADQDLSLQLTIPDYEWQSDSFLVWTMDRIGYFMKGLVHPPASLDARQADLRMLTGDIDTQTASGRFFLRFIHDLDDARRSDSVCGYPVSVRSNRRVPSMSNRNRLKNTKTIHSILEHHTFNIQFLESLPCHCYYLPVGNARNCPYHNWPKP